MVLTLAGAFAFLAGSVQAACIALMVRSMIGSDNCALDEMRSAASAKADHVSVDGRLAAAASINNALNLGRNRGQHSEIAKLDITLWLHSNRFPVAMCVSNCVIHEYEYIPKGIACQ